MRARVMIAGWTCAVLVIVVAAQSPGVQRLGDFRWAGSIASVLVREVADDRLLVQVRSLTASNTAAERLETRGLPADAMNAWVLLEDGSGLVGAPREPPKGEPAPGVANASEEYSFVTFGFTRPARARVAAVVVKIERQYHAFAVSAPAGADPLGREQPAMISPAPYKAQARQIEWSLSGVIQVVMLMDQGTFLKVELAGRSLSGFRGQSVPAPSLDGLQVWLLRNDGTVLRQRSPIRRSVRSSTATWATHAEDVTFDHATFQDLAALVLRAERKLIIRELPRARIGGRQDRLSAPASGATFWAGAQGASRPRTGLSPPE